MWLRRQVANLCKAKPVQTTRRGFVQGSSLGLAAGPGAIARQSGPSHARVNNSAQPGRIVNEYDLFLEGEREALAKDIVVLDFREDRLDAKLDLQTKELEIGDELAGWRLLTIVSINGTDTAVFEKHVTHQGVIVYVTKPQGVIARIPKGIGDLSRIRPRKINAPHVKLDRQTRYVAGPDVAGNFILNSQEDPCYENVAALGKEYIGWSLVANEQAGPLKSLYIEPDGTSRQVNRQPEGQGIWAPDVVGRVVDPKNLSSR